MTGLSSFDLVQLQKGVRNSGEVLTGTREEVKVSPVTIKCFSHAATVRTWEYGLLPLQIMPAPVLFELHGVGQFHQISASLRALRS